MTSKKFSSKRPLTDTEEAEIQRMIASDLDNPELTDDEIAGLRPFAEVLPLLAESIRRGPGRPKLDKPRDPVTLRLDRAVVEHFPRSTSRLAQAHGAGVSEGGVLMGESQTADREAACKE